MVMLSPSTLLISINTLYYDTYNLLVSHTEDVANQISWLNNELEWAQQNNITVWLMGHIYPSAGEATAYYRQNLANLVMQYNNTVRYQFWGHSHLDEYIIYATGNVGWITPSVMPDQHNPSYRVFTYDNESFQILDYTDYVLDLDYLISTGEFQYNKYYSATESYGLGSMESAAWVDFYLRMSYNQSLFDLFYQHYNVSDKLVPNFCADECRIDFLKDMLV